MIPVHICRRLNILAVCAAAFLLAPAPAEAQSVEPSGSMTYFLPSTTIVIEVEAVRESFTAGPYARYATKYLGMSAGQSDKEEYFISGVRVFPRTEADQSRSFLVSVGSGADLPFLQLTSCGLVANPNAGSDLAATWRFPVDGTGSIAEEGLVSNVASESTTLYRSVRADTAYTRVAVQQEVMVAKTLEQKAEETARLIFELRRKRVQITTGDTDATYSGEAMGAALAEIARLEKEYLSMFIGRTERSVQTMTFEVIPQRDRQMYVAFRLSETAGLVPAEDMTGRPYVLEVTPPDGFTGSDQVPSLKGAIAYRIPAVCTVRLLDGSSALLNTRIPVCQLGTVAAFPLKAKVK